MVYLRYNQHRIIPSAELTLRRLGYFAEKKTANYLVQPGNKIRSVLCSDCWLMDITHGVSKNDQNAKRNAARHDERNVGWSVFHENWRTVLLTAHSPRHKFWNVVWFERTRHQVKILRMLDHLMVSTGWAKKNRTCRGYKFATQKNCTFFLRLRPKPLT